MIQNSWVYTQTQFDAEKFLKATQNIFLLVSAKPYQSKKDPDDKGTTLTLSIMHDDMDYGVDKKTGKKRDNNVLNTFDVTILNGKTEVPFKRAIKCPWQGSCQRNPM